MIVAAKIARGIAEGRVTEDRRPVDNDGDPPFHRRQRVPIQTSLSKPPRCYVAVKAVRKERFVVIPIASVEASGYGSISEWQAAWVERFGSRADTFSYQWVTTFRVEDDDLPRLLHRRSERGYTDRAAEAMSEEPEAVDMARLSPSWGVDAAARHAEIRAEDPEYVQRLARQTANRVREALITRSRAGDDILVLVHQIELLL